MNLKPKTKNKYNDTMLVKRDLKKANSKRLYGNLFVCKSFSLISHQAKKHNNNNNNKTLKISYKTIIKLLHQQNT